MSKYSIELKWAIAFVTMSLIWMFGEKLSGLHSDHIDKHAIYTNFIAIPAVAIYVFALLDKRKNYYNGFLTYKQGFLCGLIITLIVTLLSPLTQYIISVFVTPEYFPNVIKHVVSTGNSTQAEAEKFFSLHNYMVMGLIGTLTMGLLTSASVAYFTKSKPQVTG